MSKLRTATSPHWVEVVLSDFDDFLLDHASCERKASSTALALLSHYPDRRTLVDRMAELAREELEHFHQVLYLIHASGGVLRRDDKDPYIQALRREIRHGREEYFLDRLLVFGLVEARGCERFGLLADALPQGALRAFYREITRSESQHHALFLRLAKRYFDAAQVDARQDALLDREAEIVEGLALRPAVH